MLLHKALGSHRFVSGLAHSLISVIKNKRWDRFILLKEDIISHTLSCINTSYGYITNLDLIRSQLAKYCILVTRALRLTAPISQRSWVRIPLKLDFIFRL